MDFGFLPDMGDLPFDQEPYGEEVLTSSVPTTETKDKRNRERLASQRYREKQRAAKARNEVTLARLSEQNAQLQAENALLRNQVQGIFRELIYSIDSLRTAVLGASGEKAADLNYVYSESPQALASYTLPHTSYDVIPTHSPTTTIDSPASTGHQAYSILLLFLLFVIPSTLFPYLQGGRNWSRTPMVESLTNVYSNDLLTPPTGTAATATGTRPGEYGYTISSSHMVSDTCDDKGLLAPLTTVPLLGLKTDMTERALCTELSVSDKIHVDVARKICEEVNASDPAAVDTLALIIRAQLQATCSKEEGMSVTLRKTD
ncbi:bZIP transcription factor domain protein [Giardia muris]|uniref:BZIP transcription factor domain protein n=1 Tax=Giardia muris TaxID=5742 RepID=A0A4Z1T1Q9_GIAMU|nr:bZIP transcription factor domain protein [Giardia muris]|eukprot:TNJ26489.1 bZIP transcription factor domain protein [Giardia muris]